MMIAGALGNPRAGINPQAIASKRALRRS